ncbi:hypothetical protein BKA67DRAFT_544844 [Truncatella angustata]|uniref:Uncharacterized protein n=1 Tax=Truncatella angustata TaxID=152316 RepID=A0A9P8UWN1_9PEZI|nr:uncharacterized protein BKA67DRAFT_544844 [Truncatella angustata]KAH6659558.1 hypothetical protein BKA67DRAFT_544844 [Truncatella angustata]
MIDVPIPGESLPEDPAAPAVDLAPEPVQPTATADFAAPDTPTLPQSSTTMSSSATPVQPTEIVQDSQKRKRRSASPVPRAEDVAAKRARTSDEERVVADIEMPETNNEKEAAQVVDSAHKDPAVVAIGSAQPERPTSQQADSNGLGNPNTEITHGSPPNDSYQTGPALVDNIEPQPHLNNENDPDHDHDAPIGESVVDAQPEEEFQRDLEPPIHPVTPALYIKNFMRPLRPQAVQDHLLDLATPAGVQIDEQTISAFHLDSVRTHSFVLFSSITAAKRVRSALHNRVWPDETNRKPLWIDYIPADRYRDFVDMELAAGSARGSGSRYEVVYEHDHEGHVTTKLEESGGAAPAAVLAPQLEHTQSIPTGPSRSSTGIEGAPTGPRGLQGGGRSHVQGARTDRSGDYKSTIARPSVPFQAVPEELVQRRLDAIRQAKSRDYDQAADKNKEYRRYFYENGDHLVDRGPEIFLGIRPPHRERERRQDQERGDRRRGGGGGRRNGRRGMPMHHGVPKGGDRYRGTASSSADYDDRPRYDDRGGDRYRGGDSYRRR